MKIGNIIIDKKLFMTIIIIFVVVTFFVGYSYLNSDLNSSLTINLSNIICNQENLNDRLTCMATPDNIQSKYVSSKLGINFSQVSSDTNGNGIYMLASTIGDTYPVSYYRGVVSNNNVKFGGYCWKIVRTTNTGGTKLIYNGVPDGDGHCSDPVSSNSLITSYYAHSYSPAYIGYMYGDVITRKSAAVSNYYFSSSFSYSYEDNLYTLKNPVNDSSQAASNHYSCLDDGTSCQVLRYIFYQKDSTYYYIELTNNDSVTTALNSMLFNSSNTTNSRLKDTIDTWYLGGLSSSEAFLEDTVWCNDRSITDYGTWNPSGGVILNTYTYFNTYTNLTNGIVDLSCPANDSFTASSQNGNGKLLYKIGTLTVPELYLAGLIYNYSNTTNYLTSSFSWFTMTPSFIGYDNTLAFFVDSNGKIDRTGYGRDQRGVRPAVSLRHEVVLTGGDGSSTNPYTVDLPFTPSQLSSTYSSRFTMIYDNETLSNNISFTSAGGWEYIIKTLSLIKGKKYTITFDYTLSNNYEPLSGYNSIGFHVVNLSSDALLNKDSDLASNSIIQSDMATNAGTYSATLVFTADANNHFVINGGRAKDGQTINFSISNFYVKDND